MKRFLFSIAIAIFLVNPHQIFGQATQPVEQRVNELVGKMTVEEKIDLIHGVEGMHVLANDRLGLPKISMSDGPCGVHSYGKTTAYPATIGLAASFDVNLARRFGDSMGSDARARGVHFVLAPALNIYRTAICGRNFEYLGEDPYLAGQIVTQIVRGIQSHGVAATVKHFACNNQEVGRGDFDSVVDERTLNEIYLPAFKAAVVKGHAWAVMAAYNLLNGEHCSENLWLLENTLKKSWGFKGIVMSDWGATHSTMGAFTGGLDLEMPDSEFFNGDKIPPLLNDGRLSKATLDDKVRRLLRVMISIGALDRPQKDDSIPADDPKSDATALQIAREAIVLLKNDNHSLPLDRSKVKTILVVGPNATADVHGGGGSSYVDPFHTVNFFDGIKAKAGAGVNVVTLPLGVDKAIQEILSRSDFLTADGAPGLNGEYFMNKNLDGKAKLSRVDAKIAFDWKGTPAPGINHDEFSVRWTGKVKIDDAGTYAFALSSDDGSRLFIDGKLLIDSWSDHGAVPEMKNIDLQPGLHDVKIEYYQATGDARIRCGWGKPPQYLTEDQQNQIKSADAVVFCAGFNPDSEHEGADRTFALPFPQDDLIAAVEAVNPHTIVSINSGGGVDMNTWLAKTPAVLQTWYPGQEGGIALGEILFGDVNPSAKLPATFEKHWEDSVAAKNYPQEAGKVYYREGIFVGYRHFDHSQIEPQFCFGHGLSYTTFDYKNLNISPADDGSYKVTADITNTGDRDGTEVVQLYVGQLQCSFPRPVRELKAFARLDLKTGETKQAVMTVPHDAFAYYDVNSHGWTVEPGQFEIAVGKSSRDLPLKQTIEVGN